MRLPSILPLLAILAACGGSDPVADGNAGAGLPDIVEVENAAGVPVMRDPADGSRPTGAKPAPPPNAIVAASIPAFLHGRWGLTPGDCTSTRGDAKGLLVITGRELRFYESRAVPAGNTAATQNSFSADFTFTGEGQSWSSFQTLQLQDKKLVRTTSGPMASYSYAKCD